MTITVLPMDATAGSPTYSAKNARQAQAPMYGAPTGAFSTRSGWRVGTTSGVVSVTSSTWTLNPCSAMISPAASLYQGSYGWATDQAITGPMTAADATNPRRDILYIQINDSSAGDGSGALSAPVLYLAGAATATPAAPDLPPRSFLVGTIAVPKSGGGSPTIAFNQQYAVAAGSPVPVFTAAEFNALTLYPSLQVTRFDLPGAPTQAYDGNAWWDGAQTLLAPLGMAGWNVAGYVMVEKFGTGKKVTLSLSITRTGNGWAIPTSAHQIIGTVGPPGARGGPNAPLYFPISVIGPGNPAETASLLYGNSDGTVSLKTSTAWTLTTGSSFAFDHTFYIPA